MKKAICFTLSGALFLIASATAASAVTVNVPSTATGGFGSPNTGWQPFVAALSVSGPGTITITYTSGTVIYGTGRPAVGPNGGSLTTPLNALSLSLPLDEAVGINTAAYPNKIVTHIGALIGAFVPKSIAGSAAFQPVDGTKGLAPVGIVPSDLFYVGDQHVIYVRGAGTLYLGINDDNTTDNSGSFNVTVVSP
jgi:hypothetical protein